MNFSDSSIELPNRAQTQMSEQVTSIVSTRFLSRADVAAHDYTKQVNWILPIAISSLLILLTAWILTSLIVYGIKTNKWRRTQTSSAEKLNVGFIYTSVVFCAVFCLLHQIINMLYLNVGFYPLQDELCDMLADTAVSLYFLILFCVNLFYWFRQRIFFENEMLKVNYNNSVKVLSVLSIFVLFFGGLAVLVINNLPDNRRAGPNGCTFEPKESLRVAYWVPIVAITIVGQFVLLGLLAYAVKVTKAIKSAAYQSIRAKLRFRDSKTKTVMASMPSNDSSCASATNSFSSKSTTAKKKASSKKVVRKILKKTLMFGLLSSALDIFIQILIHYLTSSKGHRRYVTTVSNINAFLNLLFLVFSFVQYKDIFSSPFKSFKRKISVQRV